MSIFEKNNIHSKLQSLNSQMLSADFWQDKNNSQIVIKEKKFYEDLTNSLNNNVEKLKDLDDLYQLALEEENLQVQKEVFQNIKDLRSEVKKNEIKCFLSNEADPLNCYIEIHACAGGTESQDWADMLRRMYLKWSDKKNFKSSLISEHRGEEAGIKSATIKIDGDYVFGWLKKESGIHRLVRISPFDSGARRHTSFASVWIYPVVDENINIEILEKDLRIDVFRAGGPGGQSVNTTDSAVRITHIPTGLSVSQQDEKSQHKNKAKGMKILRARLYELERSRIEKERSQDRKNKIGTGDRSERIRTYNFPQGRITDHRINLTLHKLDEFLEGVAFDEMIESLTLQAQEESLKNI